MVTTKPIESLWVIDSTFGTDTRCECVVDNGSKLIVIRKDKWQKTGSDYIPSRNILMETTNNSASWTLGITKNLKMTIQGLSVYVQAQIIEDAVTCRFQLHWDGGQEQATTSRRRSDTGRAVLTMSNGRALHHSESSRGRAQPHSAFVRATQLPRALRLIYVSRVCS